ncbi:MAG TPA: hypothetical protein VK155_10885 [Bacteroidales bacterium]|jgi:N-acetylglucosamine kinase-like BadF-type ATPase|nr:hypothetical protein [Bacteroidales bacterium]
MILVVDSGSTKTEWRIINGEETGISVFSSGINPYFLREDEICGILESELSGIPSRGIGAIYFYGTGCNSETKNKTVKDALERYFSADEVFVGSDLLGAARSLCQSGRGIACIIGTGSNSCFYDGRNIVSNVAPLGYILGDEGGGAVLGRKLISGVLKKQFSASVNEKFFETYKITASEILENVYTKPFPNRFLGQFARFISTNIQIPDMQELIISSFDEFIKRNVLQYPESKHLPVSFTGSIAYNFRTFLTDILKKNGLNTGIITLSPMEGLMRYHISAGAEKKIR